jgi:hypothetical protein
MSDFGADKKPDLNVAKQITYSFGFKKDKNSNVMQWTYPGDGRVQKIANRRDKTNIHFKLNF